VARLPNDADGRALRPEPPLPEPLPPQVADARMRELYRVHSRSLYRFLLSLTLGQRQAAEDLVQETLLRAWRNVDILDSDISSLRPWLLTVARRIAIDASRSRSARPAVVSVDLDTLPAEDRAIDRVLTADVVRRALPKLSREHRTVLFHLYLEGRSMAETATLLGIPEGTVKSRAYYALRSMRAAIGSTRGE
jgi:RNA polymerase sigma-70 factor (ECF subfamily)